MFFVTADAARAQKFRMHVLGTHRCDLVCSGVEIFDPYTVLHVAHPLLLPGEFYMDVVNSALRFAPGILVG